MIFSSLWLKIFHDFCHVLETGNQFILILIVIRYGGRKVAHLLRFVKKIKLNEILLLSRLQIRQATAVTAPCKN